MKTTRFQGIEIKIDRPKGTVQEGKDENGKPWSRTYLYDYGYIPNTEGGDGEDLDVFLGPDPEAHEAYWVVQNKLNGKFDEWKVMLGFPDKAAAKKAYLAHIPAKHFGSMATMRVSMMKGMLGLEPGEKIARAVGMLSELEEILL